MTRPPLDSFVISDSRKPLDSFVQPTAPQVAAPDTLANTASFPATGTENPLGIAAKTIGNIPSSAVNFVKGAFDFLNPMNAVKSAQNLGTALGDTSQPSVSALDVAKEIPHEVYKTLTPKFLQHAISGDYQSASATLQNDPIGQVLPLLFVAKSAATKAGVGAQFDNAISTLASPVTKSASGVAKTASNIAGGATKFAGGQLTGLSPSTLEQVVSNPTEFSKQAQSTITRPALAETIGNAIKDRQTALSDTGSGYESVRNSASSFKVDPAYLSKVITDITGLKIDAKGKLQASGSSSIRLPSDINSLQSKLYDVWQPEFAKGYLTPKELLNFRADLSKLAYNDSGIGKSTDLSNLSSVIRGKVNSDLRPNVPGLDKLDSTFGPQLTELKDLSKGLVDHQGNLTDAAINRIANATGKGKDPQLARLEQLHPGITDKIKILKAVEDIQNSRENKPGTYIRAGALGAGVVTLNPYLIVSAIMSLPEVAVPLMRGLGYSSGTISSTLKTLGLDKLPSKINKETTNAVINDSVGITSVQNNKK